MLGYEQRERVGMTCAELTHPEDRARSNDYVARLRRGEVEYFQHEKRYLDKSGRTVWVLLSVSIVHGGRGQPLYAVGQMLDVTAIRSARDERDLIFRSSLDLLCLASIHGRFLQLDPAWTRLLGWAEDELQSS